MQSLLGHEDHVVVIIGGFFRVGALEGTWPTVKTAWPHGLLNIPIGTFNTAVLNYGREADPAVQARLKMRKEQSGLGHRNDGAHQRTGKPPRRAAFTMVEVLVSLAILGFIMTVIYASWTAILRAMKSMPPPVTKPTSSCTCLSGRLVCARADTNAYDKRGGGDEADQEGEDVPVLSPLAVIGQAGEVVGEMPTAPGAAARVAALDPARPVAVPEQAPPHESKYEVLDAAGPSLRVVANVAVGYNNVDVAAARARGNGAMARHSPLAMSNAKASSCGSRFWSMKPPKA